MLIRQTAPVLGAAGSPYDEPGQWQVSLAMRGLRSDDQLDAAVDVREPLRVQLLNGAGAPDQFVRLALAPYATSGEAGNADPAVVISTLAQAWSGITTRQCDVMIVNNISGLSRDQVRDLEEFVYAGGGLLIAPGPATRIAPCNDLLYRGGTGLLPAELKATPEGAAATRIGSLDRTHAIFQFMRGQSNPLPAASITRYFGVDTHGGEAHVLSTYATGEPFLIERPYGRGRVLLLSTSLDTSWNTLPLSSFFLPFVQSAARYLAVPDPVNRNLAPGEPIDASFAGSFEEPSATLTFPNGQTRDVELLGGGEKLEVHFTATNQPGRYTLRLRSARKPVQLLHYVVRPSRDEADLTPLPKERWAALERAMGFRQVDAGKEAIAAAVAGARSGRELHLAMLAAAGAFALLELVLGRIWLGET